MNDEEIMQRRNKIIAAALAFGLPREEAEDAASHAILKSLQNIGTNQKAYFAVIDYLRSQGYRGANSYFQKKVEIGDRNDEKTVALEANSEPDLLSLATDLFSGLDSECRTTLLLHLVWGLTRPEIGFVLGVKLHQVDAAIRRAKRHLLKKANTDNSEP